MNEVIQNEERTERTKKKKENLSGDKFQKISQSAIINEKIAEEDPTEENHPDTQPPSDILIFENGEKFEEAQNTDLETLLAAWWKYKRANKLKKKKKKILKIYRDENYWTHDRYTDDEDFIN